MGDENSNLTPADARQLLRRSGFGARPDQVAEIENRTRGDVVDELLNFNPTGFRPGAGDTYRAHNKWIKYMVRRASKRGQAGTTKGLSGRQSALQEKLVLFWHDHFATGDDKVFNTKLMTQQNKLFRQNCKGNFRSFMKAVNKDPAMMEYLDTVRNGKFNPNENYARELQELFMLGVNDFDGNPNYDQEDIVQIARAFSGWDYTNAGKAVFEDFDHNEIADDGPKLVYAARGNFAMAQDFASPEGDTEIDQVVDIILQHRDTDLQNTTARFLANKLFLFFTHTSPAISVIDAVIDDSNFDVDWDITALLREIFVNDAFYETGEAAPFDSNTKKSVRWPVDFVVGTLACFDMRLKGRDAYLDSQYSSSIYYHLDDMGQLLFYPPSVFGWDWEEAWLSSFTLLARYNFAKSVITARDGNTRPYFRPSKVIDLVSLDIPADNSGAIVDAALDAMGVPDQVDTTQRDALRTYLTEPGLITSHVDLSDEGVIDEKIRGLFFLILASPAYNMH